MSKRTVMPDRQAEAPPRAASRDAAPRGEPPARARRGRRPPGRTVELTADAWQLREVDELTGEVLTPEEVAYRAVIRSDHEQGMMAIDATYYAQQERIHEPLRREQGSLSPAQEWELRRSNSTTLRIPLREIGDPSSLPD